MSISEPFIRRPIATTLLMLALLLVGLVAFRALPVSALPEIEYPTIVVSTYFPGASADTMASSVTMPLERQLGQTPSLVQMTSVTGFATSQITMQFDLRRSIDAAEQDVQAAINAAANLLPPSLPVPPTYSRSNPADPPVLTFAISADALPLPRVHDYVDSVLAQKISQLRGVGLVTLNGGQKPAVRVQVDPRALAGTGLSLEDVRRALVAANVDQAKGALAGARQSFALTANDQLLNADAFKSAVIAYRNGAPVRLNEIGNVVDGVENSQLAAWVDDRRAIILNVHRQPGSNVLDVAKGVKSLIAQLGPSIPAGLDVHLVADRTETVRASVVHLEETLAISILLVIVVIFGFLRSVRATIIPSIAVPLSVISTFGVMYVAGYSINNLTLMSLTVSTGFVIDDAIVMLENITRYIEQGDPPLSAALKGARQIGFTIVSLTVSLIAVLIPLLLVGGIVGRLFREFAVTLAVAMVVSAVLSLTLTPMMCAHQLRPREPARHAPWMDRIGRITDGLVARYDRGLAWTLAHKRPTLLATVFTVALTGALAYVIPKGFFPQQDVGILVGTTEASAAVSFSRMMELQRSAVDIVRTDPDVASVSSFIGDDGTNMTPNTGRMSVVLKPREDRDGTVGELIARLQQKLAEVGDISVHLQPVQDLQLDSRVSRTQFQYTLEASDPKQLKVWAERLLEKMKTLRELGDVASDQEELGLELGLTIDRDSAARVGVSAQEIDETLYDAFGQRQVSTIHTQLNLYRVVLEVKPEYARDPDALSQIYVRSRTNTPVPLSSLVRYEVRHSPLATTHQGQFPAVTLSFNLARGASLGAAVRAIRRAQAEIGLPPSVHAEFQGAGRLFLDSLTDTPFLVLAAIVSVYIVLGILYESYIHPITILSTLPSAGVGAFLTLLLVGLDFDVVALIGIILLIGIVKKNAIMMIDFALEAERDRGLRPEDSIREACRLRFRPIMMTTAAALLGAIPLAVGTGVGAELRMPLGLTIVGGLVVSQVLTLFTTPVIYVYMAELGRGLSKRALAPDGSRTAPFVRMRG